MTSTILLPFQPETSETKAKARPFLKWAGGKGQLLEQFSPYFPKTYGRYLEPFIGSAAVFFHLRPRQSFLSDINSDLINCYISIRDNPGAVMRYLRRHQAKHSIEYYYDVRGWDSSGLGPAENAARFIYLNKTCFNGLYRVNAKGQFNVPIGSYSNPTILDKENILAVSRALKNVEILNLPFWNFCRKFAKKGDFIYFDPPYQPLSKTANFTGYTKESFSLRDQERLRDLFDEMNVLGCKLMLSNSWCPEIAHLYKRYKSTSFEVLAKRAINCQGARRAAIKEFVILNYVPDTI